MAEVEYMHVCDYAFQAVGNKACIIGIFEHINAPQFPWTHPHMVIAAQLRGQQHEVIPIHLELARPNGDVLASVNAQVNAGPDGGAFVALNLITIVFPDAGRYVVKATSAGRTLASHSIRVNQVANPQQPPPVGPLH